MTHGMPIAGRATDPVRDADEDRLTTGLVAGDAAIFDQLVWRHQDRVARLARRLLAWPADVDDVVQEVFLAVWVHRERFRGRSSLSTWLTTITVNKCRNHERNRLLRLRLIRQPAVVEAGRPTNRPPPLDTGAFARVQDGIRALPRRYREVVVLRYLEEMPVRDIGEVLGISEGAAHVRLSRAKDRLARSLEPLSNR